MRTVALIETCQFIRALRDAKKSGKNSVFKYILNFLIKL